MHVVGGICSETVTSERVHASRVGIDIQLTVTTRRSLAGPGAICIAKTAGVGVTIVTRRSQQQLAPSLQLVPHIRRGPRALLGATAQGLSRFGARPGAPLRGWRAVGATLRQALKQTHGPVRAADQRPSQLAKHDGKYVDAASADHARYQQEYGQCRTNAKASECIETLYSINRLVHGTNLPVIPRDALRGIVERDTLAVLGINGPTPQPTLEPATSVVDDETG